MARDPRRLAAIVSADVAGYSRLMGLDESGTLARLKAHRSELLDPKISEYGGRIVKTTGDGLLLEFPSVVDAVRCAVDMQRGMAGRNAGVPADQRIDFRVGINVGDIITDGDDIYGDGVNIAARLQAAAEPGEIYVSKVVQDQVRDKLGFSFEDLGPRALKNIARPIEVYRIRDDKGDPATVQHPKGSDLRPLSRKPASHWRWVAGAVAVIAVGIAGYAYFQPKSSTTSGPPLLSVAVMPLVAASTSADDEAIAERLTRDLTSAVQRASWARVAPHGLAAAYRGKAIDPRAVGRDLNVRYLVEGDVGAGARGFVVRSRMVETTDGAQVWSGPPVTGDGATTADLAARLANGVRQALFDSEQKRIARRPDSGASALELVLQGWAAWEEEPDTLKRGRAARPRFEEALRLDPGSVEAMLGLYYTILEEWRSGPGGDDDRLLKELDELSARAVKSDRNDFRAWILRSQSLEMRSKFEGAFEANAEALRINPDSIDALFNRGWLLLVTGRAEEAFPFIDQALARGPSSDSVSNLLYLRCRAHLLLGHYDDAIAACEQASALYYWWPPQVYLIAAYAQKGDIPKATAAKEGLLKQQPGYTVGRLKELQKSWNNARSVQQRETHLYPGLRKAGVPEQ